MKTRHGNVDANGNLVEAPSTLVIAGARILGPTDEQYRSQNWLPVMDEQPKSQDGGWWQSTGKYRRVDPPAETREVTLPNGKTVKVVLHAPKPYIEQVWEFVDAPPPGPRVFATADVIEALMGAGVWPQCRAWIEAQGMLDMVLATKEFREDDPNFTNARDALKTALGWTDEQVEAVLAASMAQSQSA